jgi:hypothetical protein
MQREENFLLCADRARDVRLVTLNHAIHMHQAFILQLIIAAELFTWVHVVA